jgi:hypothetical protein
VVCLTQGSPTCPVIVVADNNRTPFRRGDPEARRGHVGGRFTGSTDESGPMKPGNSVEEKTLRIRKGEAIAGCNQQHCADPKPDFPGSVIRRGKAVDER